MRRRGKFSRQVHRIKGRSLISIADASPKSLEAIFPLSRHQEKQKEINAQFSGKL